eukprot:6324788-Prorocentrum_lima.AAC.1
MGSTLADLGLHCPVHLLLRPLRGLPQAFRPPSGNGRRRRRRKASAALSAVGIALDQRLPQG